MEPFEPLGIAGNAKKDTPDELPASRARALLRKLRDLNLRAEQVSLEGGSRVRIEGCASTDAPVEEAVRYVIRTEDRVRVLAIRVEEADLVLVWEPGEGLPARRYGLFSDRLGRATAPELDVCLDPDSREPREVERFLRRIVRAACTSELR